MSIDSHQEEIHIEIDYHSEDVFDDDEPFSWYTAFVVRRNEECLWYGLCFDTCAEAETAARGAIYEMYA